MRAFSTPWTAIALVAICLLSTARTQIPAGHFVSAHFGHAVNGPGGLFVAHPRNGNGATPITGLPQQLVGPIGSHRIGSNAIAAMEDGSLVVGMIGGETFMTTPTPIDLYHLDVVGGTAVVRRTVTVGTVAPGQRGQIAQIELAGPNLVVFAAALVIPAGPGIGVPGALGGNMLGVYDPSTGMVAPIVMTPPAGGMPGTLNAIASDGTTVFFAMYRTTTLSDVYRVPIGGGAATLSASVPIGVTGMDMDSAGNLLVFGFRLIVINPATGATVGNCATAGSSLALDPVTGVIAGTDSRIWWAASSGCAPKNVLATAPTGGWGLVSGITVVPNPYAFGDPAPAGGPGYRWIVPPGAGAPVLGNTSFALAVVDQTGAPADAASAWVLGLAPTAPPIPFLGMNILVDPATWIANAPFGPTGTLPLGISPSSGLGGYTLWFQSLHLLGTGLGSSDAMSVTIQ